MSKKKQKKVSFRVGFFSQIIIAILFFALLSGLYSMIFEKTPKVEPVSLSQVATLINQNQVQTMTVRGNSLKITTTEGLLKSSKKESEASITETLVNYGVTSEALSQVNIDIKNESGIGYWLLTMLPILIPVLFMVFFFWFLFAQTRGGGTGGGMKAFSFGQSKARIIDPNDQSKKITFANVAGNQEAKQELMEVVDFLKNPKKFFELGAKIPKGVLLTGAPGTGKTLLARAVAGEAGVPFFHLSGSEFVEMFVGVGASRVRDLFEQAKQMSPAIIFIDEIDAVGRSRGVGTGGGNDEREQTLNQILVEMDGFEPTEKVVVMAATNRADVLDQALLRPGRFDRRVYLTLPDRKEREQILHIHSGEKPFEEGIDLAVVAKRTPGFSGAELESVMNEAAIMAARHDRKKISQQDMLLSVEKVMIGPERKSHLHTERERKIVAYHEAGHAILSSVLPHADPVHKITIIPRGEAGGYTMNIPLEEKKLIMKQEYLDDITVYLGGRVAEKITFGDITGGAFGDIQKVTKLARDMITQWGMSESLGPIAYVDKEYSHVKDYSEEVAQKIDQEVLSIVNESLKKAEDYLIKHRDALEAVAKKLLEVETLEQEEYHKILQSFNIQEKKQNPA